MLLITLVKSVYTFIHRLIMTCFAHVRRQRSIRAMERLDDHLLKDIGFYREGDDIRSIKNGELVRNHRRKVRLRCAFLIRRRHRLR